MTPITIIDSIMGSGKTTWAINHMFTSTQTNFIFITPYLDQIEKIKKLAKDQNIPIDIPDNNNGKGKLRDYIRIISKPNPARIILITHSLFQLFDDQCISLTKEKNYTAIIDETIDLVEIPQISKDEIAMLLAADAIRFDGAKVINTGKYTDFRIPGLKELFIKIEKNKIENYQGINFIEFPNPELFRIFDKIYILTYLFESSLLCWYLKYHEFIFNKVSVTKGEISAYSYTNGANFKHLINIYTGPLNVNFDQTSSSLSKTWFDKAENLSAVKQLKNNIYNYFRFYSSSTGKSRMWTTFEDYRSNLTGKGYGSGFVACNARATNNYQDRYSLVYAINKYMNPVVYNWFSNVGIGVNQDEYALSQMIQWIWRSGIRADPPHPIDIYIPSPRMRKLLYLWLGYSPKEIVSQEKKNSTCS